MRERAIEFGDEVNRVVIVLIAEAATARTAADLVARGIDMHLGAIVRHLAAAGVDQHLWRAAGGKVEARHAGALGRGQRDIDRLRAVRIQAYTVIARRGIFMEMIEVGEECRLEAGAEQNGRASCRERVCQYV